VSEILNALTANPDVWSRTVFLVLYDENDGFFDHVVPPTPPQSAAEGRSNVSTVNEIYPGSVGNPSGPYGLGARVPMLVISPWSKGGWANSEIFDHTSVIRFIEKRFGTTKSPLKDPNITAWRSAVVGDLTSAFNFATPNSAVGALPGTSAYTPPDNQRHDSYIPLAPALQALPVQEPGTRPARAVPYILNATASVNLATSEVSVTLTNAGARTGVFQIRSGSVLQPPRSYTVSGRTQLSDAWAFGLLGLGAYHLSVYGPNGFFRAYKGDLIVDAATIQSTLVYDVAGGGVTLTAVNKGTACKLEVQNVYASTVTTKDLAAGAAFEQFFSLSKSLGWYDFVIQVAGSAAFRQQLAGHLENGRDGTSDPGMPAKGAVVG
jgi:phospholipase C